MPKTLNRLSNITERKVDSLLANVGDIALRRRSKSIFLNLEPKNGDRILEIGCGDGFSLFVLSSLGKNVNLTGIDLNPKAIESAKNNLKGRKVKFLIGNATKLPFGGNSFDKIIMSEVLEHIPDDLSALKEARRVLKPGGKLLITVPNANYPFLWDPINWVGERFFDYRLQKGMWGIWAQHLRLYQPAELKRKLIKAGFKLRHLESQIRWALPFNHYLITLGAVLLARGSVSIKTRQEVSKFARPREKKKGLIKIFFGLSNFVDRFNDRVDLNDAAEGIFAVGQKPAKVSSKSRR